MSILEETFENIDFNQNDQGISIAVIIFKSNLWSTFSKNLDFGLFFK